mgnify:CR=1 FL=1
MIYTVTLLVGFITGALAFMKAPCDKNSKETLKKQKDTLNWLKSALKESENNKLTKNIDQNKVKLLKLIIKRLEK